MGGEAEGAEESVRNLSAGQAEKVPWLRVAGEDRRLRRVGRIVREEADCGKESADEQDRRGEVKPPV